MTYKFCDRNYLALQYGFVAGAGKRIEPQRSARSSKAMIAGTSEPLAVHAGLEVLKHGGNAADAALRSRRSLSRQAPLLAMPGS